MARRSSREAAGLRPDPRDDPDYQAKLDAIEARHEGRMEAVRRDAGLTYSNSFEFASVDDYREHRRKNYPG